MKIRAWHGRTLLMTVMAIGLIWSAAAQSPAASDPPASAGSQNVYEAGGSVRPTGPVAGDFVGFGGRVIADHPIKGDALLVGGSVDVRAPIGDDLRAGGGDVNIESTVGGELHAAGGNVTLTKTAQVAQGAALAGGLVTIDGKVTGKLRVSAQRVVLNGEVTGDARMVAETIELGPSARIRGALSHASRQFKKADGAFVGGAVTVEEMAEPAPARHETRPDRSWERQWQYGGPSWIGMFMGFLGLLAAVAVFVLLFPRFAAEAPNMIQASPWMALAIGFGVLVGVPVLAVLLFITVLGIPLSIAAFALYPLLLLVGYLAGALFIAQRARAGMRSEGEASFRSTMGFVALALVILMLVSRLPVVGPLTVFITTIAGIGACVLEWHRRRQPPASMPTATAGPGGPAALT